MYVCMYKCICHNSSGSYWYCDCFIAVFTNTAAPPPPPPPPTGPLLLATRRIILMMILLTTVVLLFYVFYCRLHVTTHT